MATATQHLTLYARIKGPQDIAEPATWREAVRGPIMGAVISFTCLDTGTRYRVRADLPYISLLCTYVLDMVRAPAPAHLSNAKSNNKSGANVFRMWTAQKVQTRAPLFDAPTLYKFCLTFGGGLQPAGKKVAKDIKMFDRSWSAHYSADDEEEDSMGDDQIISCQNASLSTNWFDTMKKNAIIQSQKAQLKKGNKLKSDAKVEFFVHGIKPYLAGVWDAIRKETAVTKRAQGWLFTDCVYPLSKELFSIAFVNTRPHWSTKASTGERFGPEDDDEDEIDSGNRTQKVARDANEINGTDAASSSAQEKSRPTISSGPTDDFVAKMEDVEDVLDTEDEEKHEEQKAAYYEDVFRFWNDYARCYLERWLKEKDMSVIVRLSFRHMFPAPFVHKAVAVRGLRGKHFEEEDDALKEEDQDELQEETQILDGIKPRALHMCLPEVTAYGIEQFCRKIRIDSDTITPYVNMALAYQEFRTREAKHGDCFVQVDYPLRKKFGVALDSLVRMKILSRLVEGDAQYMGCGLWTRQKKQMLQQLLEMYRNPIGKEAQKDLYEQLKTMSDPNGERPLEQDTINLVQQVLDHRVSNLTGIAGTQKAEMLIRLAHFLPKMVVLAVAGVAADNARERFFKKGVKALCTTLASTFFDDDIAEQVENSDVVVFEEMSIVPEHLVVRFLKRFLKVKRILIVGHDQQLTPFGRHRGRLFATMLKHFPTTILTQVYRQTGRGASIILENAERVNRITDWKSVPKEDAIVFDSATTGCFKPLLDKPGMLESQLFKNHVATNFRDLQVVTIFVKDSDEMNARIMCMRHEELKRFRIPSETNKILSYFYVGDRIMFTSKIVKYDDGTIARDNDPEEEEEEEEEGEEDDKQSAASAAASGNTSNKKKSKRKRRVVYVNGNMETIKAIRIRSGGNSQHACRTDRNHMDAEIITSKGERIPLNGPFQHGYSMSLWRFRGSDKLTTALVVRRLFHQFVREGFGRPGLYCAITQAIEQFILVCEPTAKMTFRDIMHYIASKDPRPCCCCSDSMLASLAEGHECFSEPGFALPPEPVNLTEDSDSDECESRPTRRSRDKRKRRAEVDDNDDEETIDDDEPVAKMAKIHNEPVDLSVDHAPAKRVPPQPTEQTQTEDDTQS